MNLRRRYVALVLLVLFLTSACTQSVLRSAQADEDPRNPGLVNKLISVIDTPGTPTEGMKPGDRDDFTIAVKNPYEQNITSISLNVSIYMYATIDEKKEVTSAWTTPYIEESGSILYSIPYFNLSVDEERNITFTVVTGYDTPHGSIFSQSTYFLRFWLEFDYTNSTGTEHLIMKSPGYFDDEVWEQAIKKPSESDLPYYRGEINITYLQEATGQLDGIIPDTSFALKESIPIWPFYALIVILVISAILAFFFYIEENPGTWPWMEHRWFRLKGRLRQVFRLSKSKEKGSHEPKTKKKDPDEDK